MWGSIPSERMILRHHRIVAILAMASKWVASFPIAADEASAALEPVDAPLCHVVTVINRTIERRTPVLAMPARPGANTPKLFGLVSACLC